LDGKFCFAKGKQSWRDPDKFYTFHWPSNDMRK
jgi:hypothetical protein